MAVVRTEGIKLIKFQCISTNLRGFFFKPGNISRCNLYGWRGANRADRSRSFYFIKHISTKVAALVGAL